MPKQVRVQELDPISYTPEIGEAQYTMAGACEAGLFDISFMCTDLDTERCAMGPTIVRLCKTHREVIDIEPIAEQ